MSNRLSGVGVLDKAVRILDATATRPRSLGELVSATGLSRATAYRLARALETHEMLARDPAGRFALGPRWRSVGPDLAALASRAGPVLARLRDRTGESAQCYVRRGDERVCVAAAERPSGLRDTVPVGARLPLTAGSGAQVLLAWADRDDTSRLLPSCAFSAQHLAAVRRRGWAESVAERESGVGSVSAPVRRGDEVVAAVSVSGPLDRLGDHPGRAFSAYVLEAAAELS